MAKKTNRPSWFKIFLHQKPVIDANTDETVGKALKAALHYFETGELPEFEDAGEKSVFATFCPYVEESFEDYEKTSARNRENAMKRHEKKQEEAS